MNVSQTLVALVANAAHHEHVNAEQLREVDALLEGASRLELLNMLATMSNLTNYSLDLLAAHTSMDKSHFLQELGKFFLTNPEQ